jgi:glutamyl-tRNA synthetase
MNAAAAMQELREKGAVYPCFCTDEELSEMKKRAEELKLPPVYRGKWASASAEDVQAALDKGTPHCFRFRVQPNKVVVVRDIIRGDVKFNTDTLGDFVVMRSNGLPVYNFCVAVDDALMEVSHVLRAEEHLPNTLRQLLIYEALNLTPPKFGHMSLILAPDKSKLSKRHGATSVGEFREQARFFRVYLCMTS